MSKFITEDELEAYRARHPRKAPSALHRIPARYRKCTREQWIPDPDPFPVWSPEDHWGLVIFGGHGNGKTHAATVLWRELARTDAMWFRAGALLREIYDGFGSPDRLESAVTRCSLLLLDDLGREKAGEDATARLAGLLCDRFDAELPTIITTNVGMTAIKAWDSAVADRLAGSDVWRVEFRGESRRRRR